MGDISRENRTSAVALRANIVRNQAVGPTIHEGHPIQQGAQHM